MSRSLALIRLGALGDVIHALPAAAQLRRAHPQDRIVWVVERSAAPILDGIPWIDELLVIDTRRWRRELLRPGRIRAALQEVLAAGSRLRRAGFQEAFDLQGLIKSGVVTALTGAPRRVGLPRKLCREPLNTLFTNSRNQGIDGTSHVVDQNLAVVGGRPEDVHPEDFRLTLREEELRPLREFRQSVAPAGEPLVILNVGAAWSTKLWPPEQFGRLARELRRFGAVPVVLWGPGEEEAAREVIRVSQGDAVQAPDTTVRQVHALAREAGLFVASDTGPLHLAWAAGCPVVGLFGPTDPARNGPYRCRSRVVWRRRSCSPCHARRCPDGEDCTAGIPLEPVLQACQALLRPEPGAAESRVIEC